MIISVASGKGGTGKTLVATSLAYSLSHVSGSKVQLLDCDVEEPNSHIFLKPIFTQTEAVCIPIPVVNDAKCTYCGKCSEVCAFNAIVTLKNKVLVFSELCHGCGACSYLCPEGAIVEHGNEVGVFAIGGINGINLVEGKLSIGQVMAPPIIRVVKQHADSQRIVIIDSPPGTSCPVIETVKGSDFCLLVTEPTSFGLNDLKLAVEVIRKLNIPCGVILNRGGIGDSGVENYCKASDIPILLTIPLDREIAHWYSRGVTLTEAMPVWHESFLGLFDDITRMVDR